MENRGSHILVVDDEDYLRDVIGDLLKSAGHTVLTASNAHEAWKLWETHGKAVDLVITDWNMPGGNGFDLALKMREKKPAAKIVLMSGYSEGPQPSSEGVEGVSFLSKPFDFDELARVVEQSVAS